VDKLRSLLVSADAILIEILQMQPQIQPFGWTETFPILGDMAADARNVRACGWRAEQPLSIDKNGG